MASYKDLLNSEILDHQISHEEQAIVEYLANCLVKLANSIASTTKIDQNHSEKESYDCTKFEKSTNANKNPSPTNVVPRDFNLNNQVKSSGMDLKLEMKKSENSKDYHIEEERHLPIKKQRLSYELYLRLSL